MHVDVLTLSSFRNFAHERLQFGPSFNIFIGANAQGKTNILESLMLLSSGRSFRTSDHRDFIKRDAPGGMVEGRVVHRAGDDRWRTDFLPERKTLLRNDKRWNGREKRHFCAVLFSPEEVLLLRESPSERRLYLDGIIARFVPSHTQTTRQYGRVISSRNALLKDHELSRCELEDQLEPWNQQLIRLAAKIVWDRQEWTEILNDTIAPQYRILGENDGVAAFAYQPFCGALPQNLELLESLIAELLVQRQEDERVRRISLVGPHRDDLIASLDGEPVKRYGSQGQHRSFVLALKMAEMDLYHRLEGEWPLFLLDDVVSELDRSRNRAFFEYLSSSKAQVFVTTTDAQKLLFTGGVGTHVFVVERGTTSPGRL